MGFGLGIITLIMENQLKREWNFDWGHVGSCRVDAEDPVSR